jgi:hypothetical protein
MADDTRSFFPLYTKSTGTVNGTLSPSVTVAATSSAAASAVFSGMIQNNFTSIRIANMSTTGWAFVNFGVLGLTVVAATVAAGYPVAPGGVFIVSVDPEVNAASVILNTGTGNVVFTRGLGV